MSDAITCMNRLDALALELDTLSKGQAETERKLEPIQTAHDEFLRDYDVFLCEQAQEKGERIPPERLREHMALKAMPKEILDPYLMLSAKRRRLEKRISTVRTLVDAQRSLLSAYKVESEAAGSGLRGAA